jgi:hypothetical protein
MSVPTHKETSFVCPGCDHAIWEAWLPENALYRGCHCVTFCYSEKLKAQPFNVDHWSELIAQSDAVMASNISRFARCN